MSSTGSLSSEVLIKYLPSRCSSNLIFALFRRSSPVFAVREGKPKTVMCAYNKLNGTYCSDNGELLTRILREEWGFDGLVMTDWGAMNDRNAAFRAGCDLNMPGGSNYMAGDVLAAVARGELDEADIDRSVRRVVRLVQG